MKKLYITLAAIILTGSASCTLTAGNFFRVDDTVLTQPTPNGRNLQPRLADANIDLNDVETVLPPDAIPAVLPKDTAQIMVTAAEAESKGIKPSERVLGVSINGQHHAYPIPFMSNHEIVNTEIGGTSVAVTW